MGTRLHELVGKLIYHRGKVLILRPPLNFLCTPGSCVSSFGSKDVAAYKDVCYILHGEPRGLRAILVRQLPSQTLGESFSPSTH